MILMELHEQGAFEELYVLIGELSKRCGSRAGGRRGKRVNVAENRSTRSEGCTAPEESSTVWFRHDEIP